MPIQPAYTESMLPEWQFRDTASRFPIIDIRLSGSGGAKYQTREVPPKSLLQETLVHPTDDLAISLTFRLLELSRDADNKININGKIFHDLVEGFHINSKTLYLIRYNVHGFHDFLCYRDNSTYLTYYDALFHTC